MVTAPFLILGAYAIHLLRHSRVGGNPYTPDLKRFEPLRIWIPACAGMTATEDGVEKQPAVYILASGKHGTLYIGVTSDLLGRTHQHRENLIKGFTNRYGVTRLVHYELFEDMISAITREKQLKKWRRDWKANLIEASNPDWVDLAVGFGFDPASPKR